MRLNKFVDLAKIIETFRRRDSERSLTTTVSLAVFCNFCERHRLCQRRIHHYRRCANFATLISSKNYYPYHSPHNYHLYKINYKKIKSILVIFFYSLTQNNNPLTFIYGPSTRVINIDRPRFLVRDVSSGFRDRRMRDGRCLPRKKNNKNKKQTKGFQGSFQSLVVREAFAKQNAIYARETRFFLTLVVLIINKNNTRKFFWDPHTRAHRTTSQTSRDTRWE